MRVRLLLISPDTVLRESAKIKAREFPIAFEAASSPQHAERLYAESPESRPQVILIDLLDTNYEAVTRWVHSAFPEAKALLLLPEDRANQAAPTATGFDTCLWEAGGDIVLSGARERGAFSELLERLVEEAAPHCEGVAVGGLDELIGRSVPFREALETAMKVASVPGGPVLIVGEKGTGKRLFARAIHAEGEAAKGSFIRIDCRAVTARGLAAILQGDGPSQGRISGAAISIERGHTGAGTLFLEEIAALDLSRQARVLEFIHDSLRSQRLGTTPRAMRPRLIAATAKNLNAAAQAGSFSADLLARLQAFRIDLPPLRERPSDILLLAERFLEHRADLTGSAIPRFAPEVQKRLLSHPWPGNIRELFGALEATLEAAEDAQEVESRHLPDWLLMSERSEIPGGREHGARRSASQKTGDDGARITDSAAGVVVELPEQGIAFEEIERAVLSAALRMAGNNVVRAAKLLRLGRGSLRYRLEKYHLVEPRRRRAAKRTRVSIEPQEAGGGLRRAS